MSPAPIEPPQPAGPPGPTPEGPLPGDGSPEDRSDAGPATTLATMAGRWVAVLDVAGTVLLVLAMAVAAIWRTSGTEIAYLVVSALLFVGGTVAFAVGFLTAVGRSRTEVVDLAGLFYLTGSAPRVVRRTLLGLWFAQIAAVAVSLAVAPPFGVLGLMWGIGLLPVWGSRYGTFEARPPSDRPGRRSAPD